MLVQINLIWDDSHSVLDLCRKFAYLIEFVKVKSRFAIKVYELILLVLQDFFDLVTSEIFHR